jgi:NAD-dependent dihydropyrimidine dehydrogenase PreA subunit
MKKINRNLLLNLIFLFSNLINYQVFSNEVSSKSCDGCYASTSSSGIFWDYSIIFENALFIILAASIILLATLTFAKYRKWNWLFIGIGIGFLILFSSGFSASNINGNCIANCSENGNYKQNNTLTFQYRINISQSDSVKSSEFLLTDSVSEFSEFSSIDPNSKEFTEFNNNDLQQNQDWGIVYQVTILLILGVIISLLIKYKWIVTFRSIILLASLIYLGFYLGGCPCMIMSFQNTILLLLGEVVSWKSILWFVGLIPLTYFFGKVWCGWLCHLGAFQEFLFRNPLGKTFTSEKWQKAFKYIQVSLLIALIIQLIATRTNLFVKIDPFKVAFNLMSSNLTGYILLILLLISSVFIYRPFCRAACPVGLILGWVSRIPYSHRICIDKESCNSCCRCASSCNQMALVNDGKIIKIRQDECIACGECITKCKKDAIKV